VSLRLFSKIRHKILEGTSGRYLKYAVGEVFLIVLGIVIALQIDNWNEDRKERVKEQVLLSQLDQEFVSGLHQLQDKIALRENIIVSARWLLEQMDKGTPGGQLDVDSLTFHLQRTLFSPTFNANAEGFFLGRDMGLIRNDSLRMLLANWPNQLEQLSEDEGIWTSFRSDVYQPFLMENFPARNLFNSSSLDIEALRRVQLDSLRHSGALLGYSRRPIQPGNLMESNDFEDYLSFTIFINDLLTVQSKSIEDLIGRILEQIKK
jgi:hypothetical protein